MTEKHNDDEQVFREDNEATVDTAEPSEFDSQPENQADSDSEGEEQSELERLQAERDNYFDQLQRSVAEFANYRRRNDQERSQLVSFVRKDVISQFLPVIDDFDRALSQIPDDDKSAGWSTGLTMIETKFKNILERCDVKAIDPVGEAFDPSRHEAVATEPGTSGSVVTAVYQKGYMIGDMLVRPAMVMTGDSVNAEADA